MAIYGHIWPYMAIYGPYMADMAMYGHIWPYMAHICPYMPIYGHIWPILGARARSADIRVPPGAPRRLALYITMMR